MELRERERRRRGGGGGDWCPVHFISTVNRIARSICEVDSPTDIVVAVMVPCSLPSPLVRVAVTVIEYSVPSFRPVSMYIALLPAIS